jgi:hypothetical protein
MEPGLHRCRHHDLRFLVDDRVEDTVAEKPACAAATFELVLG